MAGELLAVAPCPEPLTAAGRDPVYRVALHAVVQVLMLVGPVMAEWQRLRFSSTFELPRRVVNRLNEEIRKILAMDSSKAIVVANGAEPELNMTADQFSALLKREIADWRKTVKERKIETQ